MKRATLLLSLVLVSACASWPRDLDASIDAILARHPRQTIAVAYYDVDAGTSLLRNEREVFHAASTMKVSVIFGVLEAVSRGCCGWSSRCG